MSSFNPNPFFFQPESYLFPEEFDETFIVKLRQYLNDIAVSLNVKETGFFVEDEVATGQLFIPTFSSTTAANLNYRPVYRTVVDFGALPNTATKSVPHGITTTQNYSIVHLYGAATDPGVSTITSALPIPYASATAANTVELNMDATNVNITTGIDRTAYTRTFVVIEYIKTV